MTAAHCSWSSHLLPRAEAESSFRILTSKAEAATHSRAVHPAAQSRLHSLHKAVVAEAAMADTVAAQEDVGNDDIY